MFKLPAPDARRALLLRRRDKKMARSPHAYVRGNTAQYYEWLLGQRGLALPQGPQIWICGDCHLGNLGPLAGADGEIELQIRDFDQSVVGNPVHDLVRLGLSLATAARGSSLPGMVTARMLAHMMDGYDYAFVTDEEKIAIPKPAVVKTALRGAARRSWKELARERIADTRPTIPMGRNFWPLSKAEKKAIEALCATPELLQLVTTLKTRHEDARVEVMDAAYWVKGCSSLGLMRYAVLLRVEGKDDADADYCLIDIKEAVQATSISYPGAGMPRDNAKRVVEGARHMSPALGERMIAARFLDHGVFVRELLPQDLKLEIDELGIEEATRTASYLAYAVGRAHARQMDEATRLGWRATMLDSRGKTSMPEWLWSSVVQLVGSHEEGYLQHCRKFGES